MSLATAIENVPADAGGAPAAGAANAGTDGGVAIAPASGGTSADNGAPASGKPEGMPDAFWNAENNAFNLDRLTELNGVAEKYAKLSDGAVDDPSKVDFKGLVAELKGDDGKPLVDLDGKPIELDAESPLLQSAAKVFAEFGLGKAAQASLVKAFVSAQMADATAQMEFAKTEMAKLGANAPARLTALQNFVKSEGGDVALTLFSRLSTAAEFEFLEKLMSKSTGPAPGANAGANGASEQTGAQVLFPKDAPRAAYGD